MKSMHHKNEVSRIMNYLVEIWKDVVGYVGYYKVSNRGRVYSTRSNKVLSIITTKLKYPMVALSVGNKPTKRYIHRLVAMAFIPNHENKSQVNHKDGNRSNNCVGNLEWSTPMENTTHAWETGLGQRGSKSHNAVLDEITVINLRNFMALNPRFSYAKLSKLLNVKAGTIRQAVLKINWKHI